MLGRRVPVGVVEEAEFVARQVEKLVMIASESICPPAVRWALGSVFTNIYAEGYPREESRKQTEAVLKAAPLKL